MRCYMCAREGRKEEATGLCRHCQVALCMRHLSEAEDHNQGGMHWTCNHPRPSQPRGTLATSRTEPRR